MARNLAEAPLPKALERRIHGWPKLVRSVREDILDKPEIPIYDGVINVVTAHDYPISSEQIRRLVAVHDSVTEHREAAAKAWEMAQEDAAGFSDLLAERLDCKPRDIVGIDFHPLAITIGLRKKAFLKQYKRFLKSHEDDNNKTRYAAGFTSPDLRIILDGKQLPYSLVDPSRGAPSDPAHEYVHVEHRYFQGQVEETEDYSVKKEDEEFLEEIHEAIAKNDKDNFRNIVRRLTMSQLAWFINERAAFSVDGRSAFDYFFSGKKSSYTIHFETMISSIQSLYEMQPIHEKLAWKKILIEEAISLQHKAHIIEDGYNELKRQGVATNDIIAIIYSLTPETGYTISAYASKEPLTLGLLREWKHEYEAYDTPGGRDKLEVWVALALGDIENGDKNLYKPIFSRLAMLMSPPYPTAERPDFITIFEESFQYIKKVVKVRVARARWALKTFEQAGIMPQDMQLEIARGIFLTLEMPCASLYAEITNKERAYLHRPSDEEENYFIKRTLQLFSAKDMLIAQLLEGKEPDYEYLFSPEYGDTLLLGFNDRVANLVIETTKRAFKTYFEP